MGIRINDIELDLNPAVPALKGIQDKTQVDIRYPLISPFAFAHIYWNSEHGELAYELEEPVLDEREGEVLHELEEAMKDIINVDVVHEKDIQSLIEYTDKTARLLISELSISLNDESYNKIFYYLFRDFVGLNKIEAIMKDYFIEDIECNGIDTPVYVVHRIYRNIKTNIIYHDVEELASFVEKLAQKGGRYISYANPLLDATLPDGSRINATYTKDITTRGPTFTIRKFTKVPWTPIKLLSFNTLSPEMLAYFWLLVEYHSNILISGGTGSGKTTMLNAIAFFIPSESRVVSIEDSVTGDSKILVRQDNHMKEITIKELVDKRIDAEVLSMDDKGRIVFVKPSDYIKHKVKKDIYEITTSTGRKIKVTRDHSLFTLGDSGLFKNTKPEELIEGKSFIATPRKLPINCQGVTKLNLIDYLQIFKEDFLIGKPLEAFFKKYKRKDLNVTKETYRWWRQNNLIRISKYLETGYKFVNEDYDNLAIKSKNRSRLPLIINIDADLLEFLGLWLGDGSYDNRNANTVIISNVDEECRDLFKNICHRFENSYSLMNDDGVSMRMHSTIFYKFMKYVLGFDGYSNTKKIPEFVINLSNEQIKHFIRGYFSADGTVKTNEASCCSQSRDLLDSLQSLLLRLEVIGRISKTIRKDKCMEMSISSQDNITKFLDIGFMQERKNTKLRNIIRESTHDNSDIIPLNKDYRARLRDLVGKQLARSFFNRESNIGRRYMARISPIGSEFNDLSHTDLLWDKVVKVERVSSDEVEVFDLSIPSHEKFLCNNIFVHNTREIMLEKENWLPTVARTALSTGQSAGEVDMFSLLKNSFRQNPDYVIVGEVRGKEAFVLFQGMASGHASMSTIHADSVQGVIRRLETPPIELSPSLLETLDAVVIMAHAVVNKKQTRRLREIVEIIEVPEKGEIKTNTPFIWNPASDNFYFKKESHVLRKISRKYGLRYEDIAREFELRTKLIYQLYKKGVFGFEDVQRIILDYYKDPALVLKKYGVV